MKKKLITLLLAIVASVSMNAEIINGTIGDSIAWSLNTVDSTLVVSGNGSIPMSGEGGPWGIVSDKIAHAIIQEGITSIGAYCFYYNRRLTSITIGNSVTSIGDWAFFNCTGLTSITLPNSVTIIGEYAFDYCTGLTSPIYNAHTFAYMPASYSGAYTIPDGIESIAAGAFSDCGNLTSVTLPNSVTTIGRNAFSSKSITSPIYNAHIFAYMPVSYSGAYTIPDGIESIAENAFSGCGGIISVTIPNSVTSIGDNAFNNCTGLTSPIYNAHIFAYMPASYSGAYTIPDGITTIGGHAFYNCSSLTSVTIPTGVTSIGQYAFAYCSKLTSVTIPNSVTNMGNSAFYGCTSLTSVMIPNSVIGIGYDAFYDVPNIKYNGTATGSPWGAKSMNGFVDGYLIYSDSEKTNIIACSREAKGELIIPNSVTSIGDNAFSFCTGLTSVTIPNGVTSIGNYAFNDVPNIIYNGTATGSPWGAKCVNGFVDGFVVYSDSEKTNLVACSSSAQGEIIIPNTVTSIGEKVFYQCSGLTSIEIPNSVTSIGENAFYNCTGLTSITIPNSVTSIGSSAFRGCSKLTTVTLNSSSIVGKTYSSYSNIGSIFGKQVNEYIIGKNVTGIGNCAFYNCTDLTSITIGNSVTSIGSSAFGGCSKLTTVTLNSSSIVGKTYSSYSNIGNIFGKQVNEYIIGKNVTSIGNYAFYSSSSLTSVTISDGVTSIGQYAFAYCSKLNSVTIPNSVTNIGQYAFNYCNSLTSVTIPNSVRSIGQSAFRQVLNIVYRGTATGSPWGAKCVNGFVDGFVVYSNSEKTNLVACSSSLQGEFIIPGSVTDIEDNAFSGCTSLTSVTIPNSVISIGKSAFSNCTGLTSVTIPNSVNSIGSSAFYDVPNIIYNGTATGSPWGARCVNGFAEGFLVYSDSEKTNLVACSTMAKGELIIPNSVTSIGEHAFYYCNGLTSIIIGNNVTSIGMSAFFLCSGLTSITIPNSVINIENSTFNACSGLTSVTIGSGVTKIGEFVFTGCSALKTIQWNAIHCADFASNSTPFYYYVKNESYNNFDIRSKITSFTFGDEVEYIPAYLCAGMNNAQITVKNCKTEIGLNALGNCDYEVEGVRKTILPDTTVCDIAGLISDGMQCDMEVSSNVRQTWTRTLKTVEGCDSIVQVSVIWKQLSRYPEITTNHEQESANSGSISWRFIECPDFQYDYYTLNGKKYASTNGLSSGDYRLVFYNEQCEDSVAKDITIYQFGIKVNGIYYTFDREAKTAMVTFRGVSHDYYANEYSGNLVIPDSVKLNGVMYRVTSIHQDAFYHCNNITSITIQRSTPLSVLNDYGNPVRLDINNTIPIYVPFGSLNAYKSSTGFKNLNLHVIDSKHVAGATGSTSATITFGNQADVPHIASCGMVESDTTAGNILEYIGLEPNSDYKDIPFFVITEEGDYDTLHYSFKTSALTLTTKESKPVSGTTALLFAETNMSDAETNCGFEWKRSDAPADMSGTKVYCPVASGTLAGRLKNLKDNVYYKYRAFYQSAAGQMYYGEWQYIFTGDIAVEFDPVLYTYTAAIVKENEATISGYALAGAADFTEQGFEYWADSRVKESPASGLRKTTAALGEHIFVSSSGINMRVTLTNLDPGTVYKYRAYGKVGEQIYYGAEQSFTTRGTYIPTTYMITFLNWDGTELLKSPVTENTIPIYTGDTPVRPADEATTYVFMVWTPELVAATREATYTAVFVSDEATTIEDMSQKSTIESQKILINGRIYILRDGNIYTVTGVLINE